MVAPKLVETLAKRMDSHQYISSVDTRASFASKDQSLIAELGSARSIVPAHPSPGPPDKRERLTILQANLAVGARTGDEAGTRCFVGRGDSSGTALILDTARRRDAWRSARATSDLYATANSSRW